MYIKIYNIHTILLDVLVFSYSVSNLSVRNSGRILKL